MTIRHRRHGKTKSELRFSLVDHVSLALEELLLITVWPQLIILVRHGQSEGNRNRAIHQTTPDHRVKLTPDGYNQARDAGRRLREMLNPEDKIHFFTSPYRRTRETTEGILESLTSDEPDVSPFPRNTIKVYEEPRLREQDFGNFQPCSQEMERIWRERANYGHFFYRIPNGESAADAYDRVSGFNETLWRYFGEEDCASACVLVTHGLMTRIFLMKWYHFSVEYFEDLRNVDHCEFVVMKLNPENGKYSLQNKLRTWSELNRERVQQNSDEDSAVANENFYVPPRRLWCGCSDVLYCDHLLQTMHDLPDEVKRAKRDFSSAGNGRSGTLTLNIPINVSSSEQARVAEGDTSAGSPSRTNTLSRYNRSHHNTQHSQHHHHHHYHHHHHRILLRDNKAEPSPSSAHATTPSSDQRSPELPSQETSDQPISPRSSPPQSPIPDYYGPDYFMNELGRDGGGTLSGRSESEPSVADLSLDDSGTSSSNPREQGNNHDESNLKHQAAYERESSMQESVY